MEDIDSVNEDDDADDETAKAEHDMLREARKGIKSETPLDMSQIIRETGKW